MKQPMITRTTCARIPTEYGEFQLCHYHNVVDGKEHLALTMGDVAGDDVLIRVHSECFTGDVLGSQRCDCGEQLQQAMQAIAQEGRGVVIYLRQEGRGIGLENKLRAYNLQDEGYDTVDANLALGHQADEREYWAAAGILTDLGIRSVRLLTNNPSKMEHLTALGIVVLARVPVTPTIHDDNIAYLAAKVSRMRHMLDIPERPSAPSHAVNGGEFPYSAQLADLRAQSIHFLAEHNRPLVTVTYAQSLDGSIAAAPGQPLRLSGPSAMVMTHALRADHDAILVGIGTILADDPRLSTRLVQGSSPRPVILDSQLRTPLTAHALDHPDGAIVATCAAAGPAHQALAARGATVLHLPGDETGRVALIPLLAALGAHGIRSVMVEGGATVLGAILRSRLVDRIIVTIAPRFVAGLPALGADRPAADLPGLTNQTLFQLGDDIVIWGEPHWTAVPATVSLA